MLPPKVFKHFNLDPEYDNCMNMFIQQLNMVYIFLYLYLYIYTVWQKYSVILLKLNTYINGFCFVIILKQIILKI